MATTVSNVVVFDSKGVPIEMVGGRRRFVISGLISNGAVASSCEITTGANVIPAGFAFFPETYTMAADLVAGSFNTITYASGSATNNIISLPLPCIGAPPSIFPMQNLLFTGSIWLPAAHGIPINHVVTFCFDGWLVPISQVSLAPDYGVPA